MAHSNTILVYRSPGACKAAGITYTQNIQACPGDQGTVLASSGNVTAGSSQTVPCMRLTWSAAVRRPWHVRPAFIGLWRAFTAAPHQCVSPFEAMLLNSIIDQKKYIRSNGNGSARHR